MIKWLLLFIPFIAAAQPKIYETAEIPVFKNQFYKKHKINNITVYTRSGNSLSKWKETFYGNEFKIKEVIYVQNDPTGGYQIKKFSYTPHKDSLKVAISAFHYIKQAKKDSMILRQDSIYYYKENADGYITAISGYVRKIPLFKYKLFYGPQNKIREIQDKLSPEKYRFIYNNDGKITEQKVITKEGAISDVFYTYDFYGKIIGKKTLFYKDITNSEKVVSSGMNIKYVYNKLNQISKEKKVTWLTSSGGTTTPTVREQFKYISYKNGLPKKVKRVTALLAITQNAIIYKPFGKTILKWEYDKAKG